MLKEFFGFVAGMFSDKGPGSSSRLMMFMFGSFSCYWLTIIVKHNFALPDAITLAGLAGFIVSPYTVGQVKDMIAASKNPTPQP